MKLSDINFDAISKLTEADINRLNEELTKESLTPEDFINILKSSVDFEDEGISLEEELPEGTLEIKEEEHSTDYNVNLPYIGLRYMSPGILLMSDFEDFMKEFVSSYVFKRLGDYLASYFETSEFLEDMWTNKYLKDFILQEAEINNFDEVIYNGVDYAIIEV